MSGSVAIQIDISGDALAVLPRLKDKPGLVLAMARAMDQQNNLTVSHIQLAYLSFPRSDPSTMEGLRRQSGRYRDSLRASKALPLADGITSSIGTNVVSRDGVSYPAVHEFGAVIPSRPTRSKNKYWAKKHPTTKGFTLLARRPIQRGIEDRLPDYSKAISDALLEFWNGGK